MLSLFRRSSKTYKIKAVWDEDASIWYVAESNVPGLHAEADTQEELLEVLRELIPELVVANERHSRNPRKTMQEFPVEFSAHRKELLSISC